MRCSVNIEKAKLIVAATTMVDIVATTVAGGIIIGISGDFHLRPIPKGLHPFFRSVSSIEDVRSSLPLVDKPDQRQDRLLRTTTRANGISACAHETSASEGLAEILRSVGALPLATHNRHSSRCPNALKAVNVSPSPTNALPVGVGG
jgi:hypothetical protein